MHQYGMILVCTYRLVILLDFVKGKDFEFDFGIFKSRKNTMFLLAKDILNSL